jgi:hypothetical protein
MSCLEGKVGLQRCGELHCAAIGFFIDTTTPSVQEVKVSRVFLIAFGKCMFMATGSVRCTLIAIGRIKPLILSAHVLHNIPIFTHVCRSDVCVDRFRVKVFNFLRRKLRKRLMFYINELTVSAYKIMADIFVCFYVCRYF